MNIAVELVPRSNMTEELEMIKTHYPHVDAINIPDLMRFELRSWEGAAIAKQYLNCAIPHLRAIDFNLKEPLPFTEQLLSCDIREVLVITGDPPQDMKRKVYPSTSIDFIKKLKSELPHLRVYAALDPYRSHIRHEYDYMERKRDAGADGFFTQPFFDLRWMDIYAELMDDLDVYWGISPVVSDKSQHYWETKNNAIFPKHFEPTLDWNIQFAKDALQFAKQRNMNMYLMPIKMDLSLYLTRIFD